MEIFTVIWNQYLYVPLFNFLVWLYENYSFYNLGIAVIILTVILRLILLPFSILAERGKIISRELAKKVKETPQEVVKHSSYLLESLRNSSFGDSVEAAVKRVVGTFDNLFGGEDDKTKGE